MGLSTPLSVALSTKLPTKFELRVKPALRFLWFFWKSQESPASLL